MALIINTYMSSQESPQSNHTKILQVLRSENLKKLGQDPRQHLYFKVKPNKSSAELIVPYKDLKNNFPYALIDFYESKMKMVSGNDQTAQIQDFQQTKANKNSKIKAFDANSEKYCQKKAESEKPSKIVLEGHEEEDKNESAELIFDYDKYLHDNVHSFKHFHPLFSDFEPVQNRYLKDLRNEAKEYERKGGKEELLEFKRKKARIDYSED